jgi:hypothetical protein
MVDKDVDRHFLKSFERYLVKNNVNYYSDEYYKKWKVGKSNSTPKRM